MQPSTLFGGLLSEKKTHRPEPDSPVEEEIPFMTESVPEPAEETQEKMVVERQRSFPLPSSIPSPPPAPLVHRHKNKVAPPPPVQAEPVHHQPVVREVREERPVIRTPSPDVSGRIARFCMLSSVEMRNRSWVGLSVAGMK